MKRIYDPYEQNDGIRILVDRLWPSGMSKEEAKIDLWPKAMTLSNELRKWYSHDEKDWAEFEKRYQAEIRLQPEVLDQKSSTRSSRRVKTLSPSRKDHLINRV